MQQHGTRSAWREDSHERLTQAMGVSPQTGQSHLILGIGSTSYVITHHFSKLCCIDALYRPLETLDAIALSPQTLLRWVHTEMNPQPQKLLKLLAALTPAQQKQIQPLLPMTSAVMFFP